MFALVLDTSSAAVTAGVVEVSPGGDVRVLAETVVHDARAHGEQLSPGIRAGLAAADLTPRELGCVVAGLGPGPFTGLRVGLVTALAFADALAIPAYGVCSLDGIGGEPAIAGHPGEVLVAGDARRKEIYWARYRGGVRLGDPAVGKAMDVRTSLGEATEVTAMAGAGARVYAEVLGLPLLAKDCPTVATLAAGAVDRIVSAAPAEPLLPLYLRRPDAVAPSAHKAVTP